MSTTHTHRRRRLRAADERGSVALYFAIITVAALAMAGMVIDGGAALASRERAADLATQAARAGANALTPASLHTGDAQLRVDPDAARRAAGRILHTAGASGDVSIDGDTVEVRARIVTHTVLLSAVGLTRIVETATATATPIYGGRTVQGGR